MTDCTSLTDEITALVDGADGRSSDLLGPVSDECIAHAEQELDVVFPPSFLAFLKQFGAGLLYDLDILGLAEEPGHWLDIVQMNRFPSPRLPRQCLLFIYAGGNRAFYFDTARRDANGEWAVVTFGPDGKTVRIADSFVAFLDMAKDGLV
jgi:hypothetical protein